MIEFNYECDFEIPNESDFSSWVATCIDSYGFSLGDINYIFCDDAYLLKLNEEFLQHDTLTDIISFDYTMGKLISGDIFISVERVRENAADLAIVFEEELKRVTIHGILHYMGYKDKSQEEKLEMRLQENNCISLFK
jgi:probable rRNA maturation factor